MKRSNNDAKRHRGATHPAVGIVLCELEELVEDFVNEGCLCYRCGEPIDLSIRRGECQISSDRIDPSVGYTKDNIAFSHKLCNCLERHVRNKNFTVEDYRKSFLEKKQPNKNMAQAIINGISITAEISFFRELLNINTSNGNVLNLNPATSYHNRCSRMDKLKKMVEDNKLDIFSTPLPVLRDTAFQNGNNPWTKEEWKKAYNTLVESYGRLKSLVKDGKITIIKV